MTYPSPAEVERIARLPDPVLRNLRITQAYHEISSAIAGRIPGGANWCTYAVWASKQAGQTIRHEDLTDTARRYIRESGHIREEASRIEPLLAISSLDVYDLIARVIEQYGIFSGVADPLARGNQLVFGDIAYHCSRFVEFLDTTSSQEEEAAMAAFLHPLDPGPPPEGQSLLRESFEAYRQARHTEDSKQRAELLLLGSLKIGYHEQLRVQPEIVEAFQVRGLDQDLLASHLYGTLAAKTGILGRILVWIIPSRKRLFTDVANRIAGELNHLVRHVVTRCLMVLELPGNQTLRLGEDIPREFPRLLQHLDHPGFAATIRLLDPTPDSPTGSGALDWTDFRERLHFIADFFRAYQQSDELHSVPFSPAQVAQIKAGRRPPGQL